MLASTSATVTSSANPKLPEPLGIFGGTFDPIHFGHLRLAEESIGHLGLGGVRWIPAGQPPHRGAPQVTAQQRLAMVLRSTAETGQIRRRNRRRSVHAPDHGTEFRQLLLDPLVAAVDLADVSDLGLAVGAERGSAVLARDVEGQNVR